MVRAPRHPRRLLPCAGARRGGRRLVAAGDLGRPGDCRRPALPAVERARVMLFIGNRNPKGEAAVRAARGSSGSRSARLKGTCGGSTDARPCDCHPPSADAPSTTGKARSSISSPPFCPFAAPSPCGSRWDSRRPSPPPLSRPWPGWGRGAAERSSARLTPLFRRLSFFGHSGGCVQVDLWSRERCPGRGGARRRGGWPADGGAPRRLRRRGSRVGNRSSSRGLTTAYEALGADGLLRRLAAVGVRARSARLTTPSDRRRRGASCATRASRGRRRTPRRRGRGESPWRRGGRRAGARRAAPRSPPGR